MEYRSILRCPVCKKELRHIKSQTTSGQTRLASLKCDSGHCFDAAKEGYVNLLSPSKQSQNKEHGDNKLMIDARRTFLDAGYYAQFRDTVSSLIAKYRADNARANSTCADSSAPVIDIVCGEGYYTLPMAKDGPVVGIDISKYAVRCAAKRLSAAYPTAIADGHISLACASANELPVIDSSCGIAVNLFAPLEVPELCRVVRAGGYFIYAVPTPKHLYGLKSILYDKPYENTEQLSDYDGFEFVERVRCESETAIAHEHIMPLFMMTPYYYRTPEDGVKRLENTEVLETTVGMDFLVYKRKD